MVVTDVLRSSRLLYVIGFPIIYAGPFCLNTNCIMIPLEEIRDCCVSTFFFKIVFLKTRWENAKDKGRLRCNEVFLHYDILYLENLEYYCIQVIGS